MKSETRRRRAAVLELELEHPLVEIALAQQTAQLLARLGARRRDAGAGRRACAARRRRRHQRVEQALLGALLGAHAHLALLLLEHQRHADLGEVADDRLDVAPDVADLGELRGLHLEEGRLGHLREPAGDLGLPDAGRPDHDDVLGGDLVAQLLGHLLPAPAIAQRDRHRALRVVLPDDVAVELGDDLARREGAESAHGSVTSADVVVGVDADLGGDAQRLARDLLGAELRVARERARRRERVGGARADRRDPVVGLDHVAVAGDHQHALGVADEQHRLEPAQHAVRRATPWRARRPPGARCPGAPRASPRAARVSASASAAPPAKPISAADCAERRTFCAVAFTTVLPIVTCPSEAIAMRPARITASTVVERIALHHRAASRACARSRARVRAIVDLDQALGGDGRVLLGRRQARVAEQLLDLAQVGAHVEQVCRIAVTQPMRMHVARDAAAARAARDDAPHVARPEPARRRGAAPQRREQRLREQPRRAPRIRPRPRAPRAPRRAAAPRAACRPCR